jgi:biopolymer transport protein ExbB
MSNFYEIIQKGGPVMYPIVGLSILTLACALERAVFWYQITTNEGKIARDILATARYSLDDAREIADKVRHTPIGRFLQAPLSLNDPTPETFRLALEAAADKEFVLMRKGDKILETIVALAPLLGLLGTVTGLMVTFSSINIGGGGTGESATKAAAGIGEALITTAAGMIVAILALVFFRVFVTLQARQMDYFSEVGSELELVYRQVWYEPTSGNGNRALPPVASSQSSMTRDVYQ